MTDIERTNKLYVYRYPSQEKYHCSKCRHEIPFKNRKDIDFNYCPYCGKSLFKKENKPMIIEIPDNATNGEVMKILFPIHKETFTDYGTVKVLGFDSKKIYTEFLVDWWDTPYRKGGTE